MGDLEYKK